MSNGENRRQDELERRIANLSEEHIAEEDIHALLHNEQGPDLLDRIVEITEEYRRIYLERIEGTVEERPGAHVEDIAAQELNLPSADDLLDIAIRIESFRGQMVQRLHIPTDELLDVQEDEVPDVRENLTVVDDVHTPPDEWQRPEGDGDGSEWNTEFSERLTALRYILYRLNIDPNSEQQVVMQIGRVRNEMMRRVSYVSVFVKPLNRIVELCNQVGNRTFVWQSDTEDDIGRYTDMGKDEKKALQDEQSGIGWQVVMSEGWMERLESILRGDNHAKTTTSAPRILRDMKNREEAIVVVQDILEQVGVVSIENREIENGNERVLVWKKTILPQRKYAKYPSRLNAYLGRVTGVDGSKHFTSFDSIKTVVRAVYEGMYDREEAENADMTFEMAEENERKQLLRELLEKQDVVCIERQGDERVLLFKKTLNPTKKIHPYAKPLNWLLGKITGESGTRAYLSHASILPALRILYEGLYDREEITSLDLKFEIADENHKKMIARELLESEGVLTIEKRAIDDSAEGETESVLVWNKQIAPKKKYGNYGSTLSVLLGKALQVNGQKTITSFPDAIGPIRALYESMFHKEEAANVDIEFALATHEEKMALLRTLLEAEHVVHIEKRGEKRVLVWETLISPQRKYGEFFSVLSTLFAKAIGTTHKLYSKESIMDPIRSLYAGMYDEEDTSLLSTER